MKKASFLNLFIISDEMKINFVGKRHPPFHHWEPIYIGTNEDPLYDERLSWEGRADKMTQVNWYSTSLYYQNLLRESYEIRNFEFDSMYL